MFDEAVLRYLNERATNSALAMVNEGINSTAPPPMRKEPAYPLADLAQKLLVGPPSLVRLIDILEGSDSVVEFLQLVREFLPNHEADIMAAVSDSYRIERFCHYFDNQYFPLDVDVGFIDDFTLGDFTHQIPVRLMGWSMDDYASFDSFRDGLVLLLSMMESPYDSSYDDERIPILEKVKTLVGKELVELIPPDGWSEEDIHRVFDETEYKGVAVFCDWLNQNTGCWQLDANYSEYEMEMWSTRCVDGLTQQWPQVIDLQEQMFKIQEWLEEDMHYNFKKLLEFMLGREVITFRPPKEQIPLALEFEE